MRCRHSRSASSHGYWRVIKPMGAFVSWLLLRAVRRRAERNAVGPLGSRRLWRSVRATTDERARALPGDERIPQAIDTLTHGVTIRRPARDVWPWLAQMGAGSRGGWYSYDWLDNGRKVVAELDLAAVMRVISRHGSLVRQASHGLTLGFYEGELLRRLDPQHRGLGQFFHDEIATPLGEDSPATDSSFGHYSGDLRWGPSDHPLHNLSRASRTLSGAIGSYA